MATVDSADFELEQYRALREEVLRSMEDGNQIMGFGLAAVGLVVSAGASVEDRLLAILIFGLLLPALSGLILSLWFAAQERLARASHFLTGVEARVKQALGTTGSVSWEEWLRAPGRSGKSQHFWSTEHAGIGLFALIIVCSLAFSLAIESPRAGLPVRVAMLALSGVIAAMLFWNIRCRYLNWKRWLSTSYDREAE